MAEPTIFSRIIAGEIPANIVYRDAQCVAFRDIQPQAPTHILIVPVEEIASIADMSPEHEQLVGHLFSVAARLAQDEGIAESGYRLIINHGADAGQTVPHLHVHLLGGRPLGALVGGAAHPSH
jgi:histidine triad (HIT) family protein